jgi:hypothetical protein
MVAKDLGPEMSHFESGKEALVIGSYAEKYPTMATERSTQQFTLLFTDIGSEVSWYYEYQLRLIRHAGEAAIQEVKAKREASRQQRSALEWIVANWDEAQTCGDSLQALATECGLGSLWGRSGEGITWYTNAMSIKAAFDEPVRSGVGAVRAKIAEIRDATY